MQTKKILSLIALFIVISFPILMLADSGTSLPDVTVTSVFDNIGNWLFYILVALGTIFVLVAAFQFLTAGGNPDAVTRARNTLTYALVGIGLGVLAKGLVAFVQTVLENK